MTVMWNCFVQHIALYNVRGYYFIEAKFMDPKVSGYFKPRFHFSADSLLLGMESWKTYAFISCTIWWLTLFLTPCGHQASHKAAQPMSKQNARLCLDVQGKEHVCNCVKCDATRNMDSMANKLNWLWNLVILRQLKIWDLKIFYKKTIRKLWAPSCGEISIKTSYWRITSSM